MDKCTRRRRVLVTGATGYVGGRLVPRLFEAGFEVRCLARTPAKITGFPWAGEVEVEVEVVQGDVTDATSARRALAGCDAAFYLVHSMGGDGAFAERDRAAATTFRDAAGEVHGLGQLVYLGALGDEQDPNLSLHLRSRQEVGRVLAEGPVPVTELRAAVIIGSGSASFEMLRHLVERLPAMVTPRWVRTRCQPIAIRDVLYWLVAALDEPAARGRVLEIGGADVVTYGEMMRTYALDFWRVEACHPPRLLRLRAEMRLPGAWLEWQIGPSATGGARLRQRALYHPRGLAGRAYWWSLLPFHAVIFGRLANAIAARAQARRRATS